MSSGATRAQAADAVGLSESGVSRALNRALKRISQPEAEQVRQRMMEELPGFASKPGS